MNAVKRCLALFAATLVVGACSGDPTADGAGANLTIRATPGAVWMRHTAGATGGQATVIIEAMDGLGGAHPGSWTTSTTGPVTVAIDPDYQNTTAGPLGNARQYIITSSAEGEGSVTFSGSGGDFTLPVRIAPDPIAFDVTFSSLNPAIAEVLTVTAPAGTRFTAATTVGFVAGALNAASNGLAAPSITGMSLDSTELTVLPAPGAAGRMNITGIASIGTPTLTSNAISVDSVTVPVLSSVDAVFSSGTPASNAPLTITMPANFKFRPTSAFTMGGGAFAPIVISRSADSLSVVVLPAPGATGAITISNVQFAPLPALLLPLPTSTTITVGAAADLGSDDPGNVGNPTFAAPTVAGNSTGWYDLETFAFADPGLADCDNQAGTGQTMWYTVTVATAGSHTFTVNWTSGTDMDITLMVKDGAYAGAGCADWLSFGGATAAGKPETFTIAALAAGTYVLHVKEYANNAAATGHLQVSVRRN